MIRLTESKGWIKVHRQLQDCPIWYGERFSKGQAWVDLLLLANHRDKKILFNGEFVTIKKGQYLTSMVKLAEKWKWSRPTVSKFLKLLESDKMISLTVDNVKTLITIEKYSVYQLNDDECLQPSLQPTLQECCTPINNPLYTNKNDKECIKNEREDNARTRDDEIQPLNFDAEKVWKDTFAIYPKKSGAHPSKIVWLDFLKDILPSNQLDVAKLIFYAIKLYLADYKKKNPDDEDYRFIPRFDKWLKEDCQYWISVYEEQQRGK